MRTIDVMQGGFRRRPAPEDVPALDPQRTRVVVGDGTDLLRVPGLRSLESVRVGGVPIPERMPFAAPLDGSEHPEMIELVEAGWRVVPGPDGCPAVERNVRSNHGLWNENHPVFLVGDFDERESPRPESLPSESPAPSRLLVGGGTPAAETSAPPARGNGGRFQSRT